MSTVGLAKGESLILFPLNGNTLEILEDALKVYTKVCIVDDNFADLSKRPLPFGVSINNREFFFQEPNWRVLALIGSPKNFKTRPSVIKSLSLSEERFTLFKHSKANISLSSSVGFNTLIGSGTFIGPEVKIGNHVIILSNSVIHHHCTIGDYSIVGSGVVLAGGVSVGRSAYIGSASNVRENVRIGDFSMVGIGSTVLRDVEPNFVVVGNPARSLSERL